MKNFSGGGKKVRPIPRFLIALREIGAKNVQSPPEIGEKFFGGGKKVRPIPLFLIELREIGAKNVQSPPEIPV